MANSSARHYVVLNTTPKLWDWYRSGDRAKVHGYIAQHLSRPLIATESFAVAAFPSNQIGSLGAESAIPSPQNPPNELVAGLLLNNSAAASNFETAVRTAPPGVFVGSGADLPFSGSDHWCPREGTDSIFAHRAAAERLLELDVLRQQKLTGRGVNVVIVDEGLNGHVLGNSYGGGWPVHSTLPGNTPPTDPMNAAKRSHAMMVAHNVLTVAPDATLFDLPMVPRRIIDVEQFFLHTADAAYRQMLNDIKKRPGPWILVNAWAIFDRRDEYPPGSYTDGPNHPFNKMMAEAANAGIDVVFCAGNCGQFCPDERCGPADQGPGQSIFGANCHPRVVSVGAVRADTLWLGYSSQGPGQPLLGHDKPDVCAPSQFCETDDAHSINTGTSAACALVGGVIAALRTKWNSAAVSPDRLRSVLNQTARQIEGKGWNGRFGNGILNTKEAYKHLP